MYLILKFKNIYVFLVAVFLFTACETHVQEDDLSEIEIADCDSNISFATSVKPIIDNKCVTCHNGSQFPDLRFYNGVSNNAENIKNQVVTERMPLSGSLTAEEIKLIRCWVDNGALNN